MFCDRCGTKLASGTQDCPSCGREFEHPRTRTRSIAGHVRLLGILWIANGALHLLPGLFLTMFGARTGRLPDMPPFAFNFMPLLGGFLMMSGVFSALVGIGLLIRHPWARIPALIAGALSLLSIPFGTALGVYTLWALLPADHEEQYRVLSHAA